MMKHLFLFWCDIKLAILLLLSTSCPLSAAYSTNKNNGNIQKNYYNKIVEIQNSDSDNKRRNIIQNGIRIALMGTLSSSSVPSIASAVERAVGVGEIKCREEGNCLEKGEWDGAIGWEWGAKDRCDPADPLCTTSGKIRDAPIEGEPIPKLPESNDGGDLTKITDVVQIDLAVGKQSSQYESIRIGLYGNAYPTFVDQFTKFVSLNGLVTSSPLALEDGYGVSSAPVTLTLNGILSYIYPERALQFGVPLQSASYAKRKGKSKAPDNYLPQPRPNKMTDESAFTLRKHDAAGLLSIPKDGLGYANTAVSEDEAFAEAFLITCRPDSALDQKKNIVIGQLLDKDSMSAIARLSNLPTRKGFAGVIPGVNAGPPLVKVSVQNTLVDKSPS